MSTYNQDFIDIGRIASLTPGDWWAQHEGDPISISIMEKGQKSRGWETGEVWDLMVYHGHNRFPFQTQKQIVLSENTHTL